MCISFLDGSPAKTEMVNSAGWRSELAQLVTVVILIHSYRPSDAALIPMPAGHWQAHAVQQNRETAPGLNMNRRDQT